MNRIEKIITKEIISCMNSFDKRTNFYGYTHDISVLVLLEKVKKFNVGKEELYNFIEKNSLNLKNKNNQIEPRFEKDFVNLIITSNKKNFNNKFIVIDYNKINNDFLIETDDLYKIKK